MRQLLALGLCSGLMLLAGAAQAAPLKYHGTNTLEIGGFPTVYFYGSGVATVNASSGGYGHLNQFINADGDITGAVSAPVTDPEVTVSGIISVKVTITGANPGTFGNISGGGPLSPNVMAHRGISKVCLFDPNCLPGGFLPMPLTSHKTASTTVGGGIGGVQTIGGAGMIRISLLNNTWTIGTASAIDQTDNGGFTVRKRYGFAHGPASLTSSTAQPSGMVQFVTPTQVSTNLTVGSGELLYIFQTLTVHFIPEPGILMLIGAGATGLVLLGRKRMRR